jgi:hypothetical protein
VGAAHPDGHAPRRDNVVYAGKFKNLFICFIFNLIFGYTINFFNFYLAILIF